MPGSIPAPNSGSFEIKKNTGSQMGHNKKSLFKFMLIWNPLKTTQQVSLNGWQSCLYDLYANQNGRLSI